MLYRVAQGPANLYMASDGDVVKEIELIDIGSESPLLQLVITGLKRQLARDALGGIAKTRHGQADATDFCSTIEGFDAAIKFIVEIKITRNLKTIKEL